MFVDFYFIFSFKKQVDCLICLGNFQLMDLKNQCLRNSISISRALAGLIV